VLPSGEILDIRAVIDGAATCIPELLMVVQNGAPLTNRA
jgi:hypothetical protein